MKLIKEPGKNEGYYILCIVGNKAYRSWWGAPSKNIDHAGLQYLKDRYSIITTEKRAAEFKRLYKLLWIEVTDKQLNKMRNALGLNYSNKPYRNRFQTYNNNSIWNDLVEKGLAEKESASDGKGLVWFWLTKEGVEFILGRNIKQSTYDDL